MSYLGRRGATAPLNSADIPDDVVQGTDIAYLENDSTTQNLGGTYSTERMYLNDSYTLNDNVTVTGHLALGSIADSDVVITQDSTERTITGSGTIESGRLMNDLPSLTGMTGELGSAVTGSPAITGVGALTSGSIGSGVTGYTGIKESDAWVVTTAFTGEASPIASNWTRNTHHNFTLLGTGMTQSSGVFTFPSTGHWLIHFYGTHYQNGSAKYIGAKIQTTVNSGGSYAESAVAYTNLAPVISDTAYSGTDCHMVFDVTNVSTHKVRFSISGNPANFSNGAEWTGASFIRIGDT